MSKFGVYDGVTGPYLRPNYVVWNSVSSMYKPKPIGILDISMMQKQKCFNTKSEKLVETILKKLRYLEVNNKFKLVFYCPTEFKLSNLIYSKFNNLKQLEIAISLPKQNEKQGRFIWKTVGLLRNLKILRISIEIQNSQKTLVYYLETKSSLEELGIYSLGKLQMFQFLFSKIKSIELNIRFNLFLAIKSKSVIKSAMLSKIYKYKRHNLTYKVEKLITYADNYSEKYKLRLKFLKSIFLR